ncbi:MAG: ATP-binding protein [Clostridiaceae bacterium]
MKIIYNNINKLQRDKSYFRYIYKYSGCVAIVILCLIFNFTYNEAIGNVSLALIVFSACIGGYIPGIITLFFSSFFLIDMSTFLNYEMFRKDLSLILLFNLSLLIIVTFKSVMKENQSEQLIEKETYLKIINGFSNSILISDYNNIIFYNKHCENILGQDMLENKENPFADICKFLNIESELKLLKNKMNLTFVKAITNGNKERKYRFYVEKKIHGKNEIVIVVVYDITSEVTQEIALLKAENNYNKLVQRIPNGVVLHDNGKMILANDTFLKMMKMDLLEDIKNKNLYSYVHNDYKSSLEKQISNVLNKNINETKGAYLQLINEEDDVIEVEVSTSKMPYYDNRMVSLFYNKTEVKNITSEEKFISEAIDYEKMKLEFFANMSHEFKTPLNILFASIQTLEMYVKTSIIKDKTGILGKYLKTMKQNCYRQLRLINNLIDISKLEAGFYNIDCKNINIVEVVENITLSIVSFAETKGIEVSFDTEEEEILMAIDEEKMERIILNLLSNAVKFTNEGEKILVKITRDTDNVYVSVKDTGIGIKKQDLPLVFNRFKQSRNSTLSEGQGSGIGLSLVKFFVNLHNGEIDIKSEESKGTEFIITLPIKVIENENIENKDFVEDNLNIEKINVEFSDIYY